MMKVFIPVCLLLVFLFTLYYYSDKEQRDLVLTSKNKWYIFHAILAILFTFSIAAIGSDISLKLF